MSEGVESALVLSFLSPSEDLRGIFVDFTLIFLVSDGVLLDCASLSLLVLSVTPHENVSVSVAHAC